MSEPVMENMPDIRSDDLCYFGESAKSGAIQDSITVNLTARPGICLSLSGSMATIVSQFSCLGAAYDQKEALPNIPTIDRKARSLPKILEIQISTA
jgi:hypothetical protein